MGDLYKRATDPVQYDSQETGWASEGIGLKSPTRAHFWEFLKSYAFSWKGKSILEIGAGTGWLLDLALEAGAKSIVGVEPAKENIRLARERYPRVKMVNKTFEDYQTKRKFDVILSVMSLTHIADIDGAFKKIASLLSSEGKFFAIVPDHDHFKRPRGGYEIQFEEVDKDEYVTLVKRPHGTLADIIRRIGKYKTAALAAGMNLEEDVHMKPTKNLIKKAPRFKESRGVIMTHLLRFSKRNLIFASSLKSP